MKILYGLSICSIAFIFLWSRVFAQPLDPSVEGYSEVKTPTRPKLKIVSPQSGSVVLGDRVTLEYITSGVKLIPSEKKDINIRGEGHLLISFVRADLYGSEATPQAFVQDRKSVV